MTEKRDGAPVTAMTYWPTVRPGLLHMPRVDPTEQRVRALIDSCAAKSAIAGVGGVGIGAAFGLFFASMDAGMTPGMDQTKMGTRAIMKDTWMRMYVAVYAPTLLVC